MFHVHRLRPFETNNYSEFPQRENYGVRILADGCVSGPEDESEYVAEKILDHRKYRRSTQYLVKWLGVPEQHSEWIFEKKLQSELNKKLIEQYNQRHTSSSSVRREM